MEQKMLVLDKISSEYPHLFSAEKEVADYISIHPEQVTSMSVSELAEASDVSDATVIRMCKHLGYTGFYQLRLCLAKEWGRRPWNPNTGSAPEPVEVVIQTIVKNLLQVSAKIDFTTIIKCARLIWESDMVHITATGNTSPVAVDMGFRLARLGVRTNSSMTPEYFIGNLGSGSEKDLCIAISVSGSSRQVLQSINMAKEKGMKVIAITGTNRSPMEELADLRICVQVDDELLSAYGITSHIYISAIVDSLIYYVANIDREGINRKFDQVEFMLAEYKV